MKHLGIWWYLWYFNMFKNTFSPNHQILPESFPVSWLVAPHGGWFFLLNSPIIRPVDHGTCGSCLSNSKCAKKPLSTLTRCKKETQQETDWAANTSCWFVGIIKDRQNFHNPRNRFNFISLAQYVIPKSSKHRNSFTNFRIDPQIPQSIRGLEILLEVPQIQFHHLSATKVTS